MASLLVVGVVAAVAEPAPESVPLAELVSSMPNFDIWAVGVAVVVVIVDVVAVAAAAPAAVSPARPMLLMTFAQSVGWLLITKSRWAKARPASSPWHMFEMSSQIR